LVTSQPLQRGAKRWLTWRGLRLVCLGDVEAAMGLARRWDVDDLLKTRLADFVALNGLRVAAERLELSPQALTKMLAGLPVRNATAFMARVNLDKLAPVVAPKRGRRASP
jgi:hypothetical protein